MVEPGFPSRVEVPEDVDIEQLIADLGTAANAIAAVVNVEQVIKDTLARDEFCRLVSL